VQIAGIIAEYDPFHKGHAAHIAATRKAGATHIVAVMDGGFTQRGEPALLTKWERTRMALAGGVDLVLELPVPWAMAPAEIFAAGGVALLHAMGCIHTLSFGSECGDVEVLCRVAEELDTPEHNALLQQGLRQGLSYAAARQAAVAARCGRDVASLLEHPNNTLGLSYIRAARQQGAPFAFYTFQRVGAGHDTDAARDGYASAGMLRRAIRDGKDVSLYLPPEGAAILQEALGKGLAPGDPTRLHSALLAHLRTLSLPKAEALPYLSEGLHNRLYRSIRTAGSYDELMNKLVTKRYPAARLRRILWASLLQIPAELPEQRPPYLRVLGMNDRGREILAAADPSLPFLSRPKQIAHMSEMAQLVFRLEQKATDLHGLTLPVPLPCGTDMTVKFSRNSG